MASEKKQEFDLELVDAVCLSYGHSAVAHTY